MLFRSGHNVRRAILDVAIHKAPLFATTEHEPPVRSEPTDGHADEADDEGPAGAPSSAPPS